LDALVPGDPDARIVNPYLAVASFRRSDAGKPFHPSSTRPAVWCRRTVHHLLTYALDADLTNPPSSSSSSSSSSLEDPHSSSLTAAGSSSSSSSTPPPVAPSSSFLKSGPSDLSESLSTSALSHPNKSSPIAPHVERKLYLYSRQGKGYTFLDVYNFIRDRLRATWQHLTVQHVQKHRAYIETLEISFRFLIFAEEQLCSNPHFDRVSNQGLMQTCLDKLMHGYEAVRAFLSRKDFSHIQARCNEEEEERPQPKNGSHEEVFSSSSSSSSPLSSSSSSSPAAALGVHRATQEKEKKEEDRNNPGGADGWRLIDTMVWRSRYEGEFWGYRILCLLSSHRGSETGVYLSGILKRLPAELLRHPNVRFALEAFKASTEGNLRRYVHLMRSSRDYLSSALMNKFANYVRATTLHMLLSNRLVNDARNPMTVERMKLLLGFDGETEVAFSSFLSFFSIRLEESPATTATPPTTTTTLTGGNRPLSRTLTPSSSSSSSSSSTGGFFSSVSSSSSSGGGVLSSSPVYCRFNEIKKSLLADLSNYKKIRSPTYPSEYLRLLLLSLRERSAKYRQTLLDPDYPAIDGMISPPPPPLSSSFSIFTSPTTVCTRKSGESLGDRDERRDERTKEGSRLMKGEEEERSGGLQHIGEGRGEVSLGRPSSQYEKTSSTKLHELRSRLQSSILFNGSHQQNTEVSSLPSSTSAVPSASTFSRQLAAASHREQSHPEGEDNLLNNRLMSSRGERREGGGYVNEGPLSETGHSSDLVLNQRDTAPKEMKERDDADDLLKDGGGVTQQNRLFSSVPILSEPSQSKSLSPRGHLPSQNLPIPGGVHTPQSPSVSSRSTLFPYHGTASSDHPHHQAGLSSPPSPPAPSSSIFFNRGLSSFPQRGPHQELHASSSSPMISSSSTLKPSSTSLSSSLLSPPSPLLSKTPSKLTPVAISSSSSSSFLSSPSAAGVLPLSQSRLSPRSIISRSSSQMPGVSTPGEEGRGRERPRNVSFSFDVLTGPAATRHLEEGRALFEGKGMKKKKKERISTTEEEEEEEREGKEETEEGEGKKRDDHSIRKTSMLRHSHLSLSEGEEKRRSSVRRFSSSSLQQTRHEEGETRIEEEEEEGEEEILWLRESVDKKKTGEEEKGERNEDVDFWLHLVGLRQWKNRSRGRTRILSEILSSSPPLSSSSSWKGGKRPGSLHPSILSLREEKQKEKKKKRQGEEEEETLSEEEEGHLDKSKKKKRVSSVNGAEDERFLLEEQEESFASSLFYPTFRSSSRRSLYLSSSLLSPHVSSLSNRRSHRRRTRRRSFIPPSSSAPLISRASFPSSLSAVKKTGMSADERKDSLGEREILKKAKAMQFLTSSSFSSSCSPQQTTPAPHRQEIEKERLGFSFDGRRSDEDFPALRKEEIPPGDTQEEGKEKEEEGEVPQREEEREKDYKGRRTGPLSSRHPEVYVHPKVSSSSHARETKKKDERMKKTSFDITDTKEKRKKKRKEKGNLLLSTLITSSILADSASRRREASKKRINKSSPSLTRALETQKKDKAQEEEEKKMKKDLLLFSGGEDALGVFAKVLVISSTWKSPVNLFSIYRTSLNLSSSSSASLHRRKEEEENGEKKEEEEHWVIERRRKECSLEEKDSVLSFSSSSSLSSSSSCRFISASQYVDCLVLSAFNRALGLGSSLPNEGGDTEEEEERHEALDEKTVRLNGFLMLPRESSSSFRQVNESSPREERRKGCDEEEEDILSERKDEREAIKTSLALLPGYRMTMKEIRHSTAKQGNSFFSPSLLSSSSSFSSSSLSSFSLSMEHRKTGALYSCVHTVGFSSPSHACAKEETEAREEAGNKKKKRSSPRFLMREDEVLSGATVVFLTLPFLIGVQEKEMKETCSIQYPRRKGERRSFLQCSYNTPASFSSSSSSWTSYHLMRDSSLLSPSLSCSSCRGRSHSSESDAGKESEEERDRNEDMKKKKRTRREGRRSVLTLHWEDGEMFFSEEGQDEEKQEERQKNQEERDEDDARWIDVGKRILEILKVVRRRDSNGINHEMGEQEKASHLPQKYTSCSSSPSLSSSSSVLSSLPPIRILFSLVLPPHAISLRKKEKTLHEIPETEEGENEGFVEVKMRRKEIEERGGGGGEEEEEKNEGEEYEEDCRVTKRVEMESQVLVANALKRRLIGSLQRMKTSSLSSSFSQADRDLLLEALSSSSSSSSSASRVRFTCAAYLPLSKSSLSQSSLSHLSSSFQEESRNQKRREGQDKEDGRKKEERMFLSSFHRTSLPSILATCSSSSPLSQISCVEESLLSSHRLWRASIPACRWIHRAIRAVSRVSIQEGNLRYYARPQGPLSLCDALVCQWKVQLEKYLTSFSFSSSSSSSHLPLPLRSDDPVHTPVVANDSSLRSLTRDFLDQRKDRKNDGLHPSFHEELGETTMERISREDQGGERRGKSRTTGGETLSMDEEEESESLQIDEEEEQKKKESKKQRREEIPFGLLIQKSLEEIEHLILTEGQKKQEEWMLPPIEWLVASSLASFSRSSSSSSFSPSILSSPEGASSGCTYTSCSSSPSTSILSNTSTLEEKRNDKAMDMNKKEICGGAGGHQGRTSHHPVDTCLALGICDIQTGEYPLLYRERRLFEKIRERGPFSSSSFSLKTVYQATERGEKRIEKQSLIVSSPNISQGISSWYHSSYVLRAFHCMKRHLEATLKMHGDTRKRDEERNEGKRNEEESRRHLSLCRIHRRPSHSDSSQMATSISYLETASQVIESNTPLRTSGAPCSSSSSTSFSFLSSPSPPPSFSSSSFSFLSSSSSSSSSSFLSSSLPLSSSPDAFGEKKSQRKSNDEEVGGAKCSEISEYYYSCSLDEVASSLTYEMMLSALLHLLSCTPLSLTPTTTTTCTLSSASSQRGSSSFGVLSTSSLREGRKDPEDEEEKSFLSSSSSSSRHPCEPYPPYLVALPPSLYCQLNPASVKPWRGSPVIFPSSSFFHTRKRIPSEECGRRRRRRRSLCESEDRDEVSASFSTDGEFLLDQTKNHGKTSLSYQDQVERETRGKQHSEEDRYEMKEKKKKKSLSSIGGGGGMGMGSHVIEETIEGDIETRGRRRESQRSIDENVKRRKMRKKDGEEDKDKEGEEMKNKKKSIRIRHEKGAVVTQEKKEVDRIPSLQDHQVCRLLHRLNHSRSSRSSSNTFAIQEKSHCWDTSLLLSSHHPSTSSSSSFSCAHSAVTVSRDRVVLGASSTPSFPLSTTRSKIPDEQREREEILTKRKNNSVGSTDDDMSSSSAFASSPIEEEGKRRREMPEKRILSSSEDALLTGHVIASVKNLRMELDKERQEMNALLAQVRVAGENKEEGWMYG
ncbi:sac3 ganp family protein, partial [Cystoisospora suis]